MLYFIAERNGPEERRLKARIFDLKFIPLTSGNWIAPNDLIYFPYVEDKEIPRNLYLNLVHPDALKTGAQKSLYESLGVSQCDPQTIVDKIMDYQLRRSKRKLGMKNYNTLTLHLRFLHFAGILLSPDKRQQLLAFSGCAPFSSALHRFSSPRERRVGRVANGFYFPSNDEYDTQRLLRVIEDKGISGDNFNPGLILDDSILRESSPPAYHYGRSWKQWLEDFAFVRSFPPLCSRFQAGLGFCYDLSSILSKVHEADSGLFLSTLRAHWTEEYASEYHNHHLDLKCRMRDRKVLCVSGASIKLAHTFFPTPHLNEKSEELGVRSAMPFLQLREALTNPSEWMFLTNFDV